MKRRVTRSDVAREAGVSPTTVSFVINNRPGPAKETIKRVNKTMEKLGYTRDRTAHALATGRTETIALWMNLSDPAFHSILAAHIEAVFYEKGYDTMVADAWRSTRTSDRKERQKHLMHLTDWPVDGILAYDCPRLVRFYIDRYLGKGSPIVSFGPQVVTTCDHVFLDVYPGTRDAVLFLVGSGRRRIGYVCDRRGGTGKGDRYRAYRDVLQAAGLEEEVLVMPDRGKHKVTSSFVEIARGKKMPEALFCYNDEIALGVFRGVRDLGLRIPEDVAIIGHDGIPYVECTDPRLSTVELPINEMCDCAIEFLLGRIEDPDRPIQSKAFRGQLRCEASC